MLDSSTLLSIVERKLSQNVAQCVVFPSNRVSESFRSYTFAVLCDDDGSTFTFRRSVILFMQKIISSIFSSISLHSTISFSSSLLLSKFSIHSFNDSRSNCFFSNVFRLALLFVRES